MKTLLQSPTDPAFVQDPYPFYAAARTEGQLHFWQDYGMMAAFGSAADAVSCALAVKRDIAIYNDTHEGEELLVRFGLNAGEPIAQDGDLFGLSVTLAARIGDWGEPGQVLVSDVVRQLLLGKGFEFTSVGSAELKGLDEPVPLYEVT